MRGLTGNLAALFGTETGGSLRATFGAPLSEGGGLWRVGGLVLVDGDLASGRLDDELRESVRVARALGVLSHTHPVTRGPDNGKAGLAGRPSGRNCNPRFNRRREKPMSIDSTTVELTCPKCGATEKGTARQSGGSITATKFYLGPWSSLGPFTRFDVVEAKGHDGPVVSSAVCKVCKVPAEKTWT